MAKPRAASIDGKLTEEFAVPSHVEDVKELMSAFAERHAVVLITSGGTKVPLESRTVRFPRQPSAAATGERPPPSTSSTPATRSSSCTDTRSLYPYTRLYSGINLLDSLQLQGGDGGHQVVVDQEALPKYTECCSEVKREGLLLPVEFSTLSEYLHLLKASAQVLGTLGSKAMFYLAAAVSDFYIPACDMPEHKIQSSNGPLQISMKMVPKILSPLVKDWAPHAFVISFKLETDSSILLDKARKALRHLQARRRWWPTCWTPGGATWWWVTPDTQAELVLTDEDVSKQVEIEEMIVSNLKGAHAQFISKQDG
ncbi:LOW QUALITY PROTEIN: hypothetical protein CRUP_022052 [Coryphaenoides rupestris]|nr:LOW QUALITY PROTEIN: hypothetical protein CRUP_022052 [Coryphaenoides rupestris]